MRCVLGFDGGGSKTECVLMDEARRVLARVRSGPSNPLRVGFAAAAEELGKAAHAVVAEGGIEHPHIVGLCAGLAGTRRADAAKQMYAELTKIFSEAKMVVVTDLVLALEATGQRPSAVLVAGTGSAAIGWDAEGHLGCVGGRGPQLGDQGSAYDIGRQALGAALRERDRTGVDTSLGAQLLHGLKFPSWSELQEKARTAADEVFPRAFPLIAEAADSGDAAARELLIDAAENLGALIEMLVERLHLRDRPFFLAKAGGMIGRSAFLDVELERRLREAAPHARIGLLPIPPAEAAAQIALELSKGARMSGGE